MPILVYGGCYRELCGSPPHNSLGGSGLRGAMLLSNTSKREIQFLTWLYDDTKEPLTGALQEYKCLNIHDSCEAFDLCKAPFFQYQNPLLPPRLKYDKPEICSSIKLDTTYEAALVYGTLETRPKIKAKKVVYDPQSPYAPTLFHENGSEAESLAFVLNASEAQSISRKKCIYKTANFIQQYFLKPQNAICDIIIIKLGHAGCWVCNRDEIETVPAFETEKVFSIGSGDIFTSAFFNQWALLGKSPVEAAREASLTTARFCSTGVIPESVGCSTLSVYGNLKEISTCSSDHTTKQIYLAGPFFNQAEIALIDFLRKELTTAWSTVFSPLHDVGFGNASEVYKLDIEGLENSDVIFVILNGQDFGTIFELGYAVKAKKRIVCLAENIKHSDLTMALGSGAKIFDDITTAVYHARWETLK